MFGRVGLVVWGVVVAVLSSSAAPRAAAQPDSASGVTLRKYLEALAERRLLAEETGSSERLRELLGRAEKHYFNEHYDRAALLLFEVVESPRFSDFVGLKEFRGAELMLARALRELGALRTASRYLLRILERGPDGPYFGPAMRAYADVALEDGELGEALERLDGLGLEFEAMPPDSQNEVRYLRGRADYDAGKLRKAEEHFAAITRKSRFYANAQYLRGVADASRRRLDRAEEHFCAVADQGKDDQYSFYVDERYFEIKDLAWLALGRVAHEQGRGDDAFYYYFQVPQDSERVAEALFESAYAMYEGREHLTALDLLDQLRAKFPASPFVHEAKLLRGYIHLARCEFQKANTLFKNFQDRFRPVVERIDRVLGSPARQERFYQSLREHTRNRDERSRDGEKGDDPRQPPNGTEELLLALLQVDPTFYAIHSDIQTLDAESARAGRLAAELGAVRARIEGSGGPRAASERESYPDQVDQLRRDIEAARAVLSGLTEQLDTIRDKATGGEAGRKVQALEKRMRELSSRIDALEQKLRDKVEETAQSSGPDVEDDGDRLGTLLERDLAHVRRLPARVASVRAGLVDKANAAALDALRELRKRLGNELRRARIGRIDAVMGSKRRVEIQIESLAAGRFPPELRDPLEVQGLLRSDEEYWPFEGEYWKDEFQNAANRGESED
jgi:outer membrane protein assembly factor BamD (BamD/ComL family)/predicted  nucleic acid-binding Zn-ribbon protein